MRWDISFTIVCCRQKENVWENTVWMMLWCTHTSNIGGGAHLKKKLPVKIHIIMFCMGFCAWISGTQSVVLRSAYYTAFTCVHSKIMYV